MYISGLRLRRTQEAAGVVSVAASLIFVGRRVSPRSGRQVADVEEEEKIGNKAFTAISETAALKKEINLKKNP